MTAFCSEKRLLFAPLIALAIMGLSSVAHGKLFRNAYVSFELGEKWECKPDQTEFVCRTNDPGLAEAIIILTAKEVGPQDALASYETHLKTPRTIVTRSQQTVQSTVYSVKQSKINDHVWVDGMHFSSEVWNYYTRYLVTIRERIAVLVTFSAHKTHYTKYSADFFRAVQSLRVIASRVSAPNAGSSGYSGSIYGGSTDVGMGLEGDPGFVPEATGSGASSSDTEMAQTFLALALIIGGAGVYLVLKRRKRSSDDE